MFNNRFFDRNIQTNFQGIIQTAMHNQIWKPNKQIIQPQIYE